MSVKACEGIWRQKCGRYVAVIACEPREGGQRWTDGVLFYADNGTVTFHEGGCAVDLVEYIGPFPVPDQTAKIELLRTTLTQQTAEIDRLRSDNDRLQAEWRSEFNAAQQLRSQVEQLEGLNYRLSEALRDLQEDHTAMDHRAEGARSAFLDVIKALWEMRR